MRMICPIKNKLETNRWLKALEIAKVIFDDEGYHILYLEQIENFIKENRMYSPRIREQYIPRIYQLSRSRKVPMTVLVNKIIEDYLNKNMEKQEDQNKAAAVRNI